jgi:multidrug efflux pump subunit AcrA (membrane-fusion protein)
MTLRAGGQAEIKFLRRLLCSAVPHATISPLGLAGCGSETPAPPPPPEVTVGKAEEITEWDEYQGECEPVDAVEVRPQVSGYLIRVAFTEGNQVKKGDVLSRRPRMTSSGGHRPASPGGECRYGG